MNLNPFLDLRFFLNLKKLDPGIGACAPRFPKGGTQFSKFDVLCWQFVGANTKLVVLFTQKDDHISKILYKLYFFKSYECIVLVQNFVGS